MNIIRIYLAKRRIRKFLTVVPTVLVQDYGRNHEYTLGQVKTAVKKLGYADSVLIDIAIAIYCDKDVAVAFGINEALIKRYRGYPEEHRVTLDHATIGSYDISHGND